MGPIKGEGTKLAMWSVMSIRLPGSRSAPMPPAALVSTNRSAPRAWSTRRGSTTSAMG